ncbi:lysine transporter LysE [Rhizobium sp. Leaf371]|uniref:LysE family translocator n=1 Tax=Rhizobium sp. Leaf371 TaxID=1736355 RepID=UPI000714B9EC|nr:LysE family translocator [Rhizobium sp. Leaf371]KQS65589.1 lysine transporter LysE [Rhizobium sp. Leaf371]
MTLASLLAYAAALFVAAAIPGPGMTAIVARALGSGFRDTFLMGLGLVLGDLVYLTGVVLGLAYVAQTFTTAFLVIKILGALYLGFIAWKLWMSGLMAQDVEENRVRTSPGLAFLSGLLVTLGNPKTMLFYVALVPTLIDLGAIGPRDYIFLVLTTFVVLLSVLIPYIVLASRARQFLRRPKALMILNRGAASMLGATAAYIALRTA